MVLKIVAVWDIKARVYIAPAAYRNQFDAARAFGAAATEPGNQINVHAWDFELHELGEFFDQDGKLVPRSEPFVICRASDFKVAPKGD